MHAMRPAAILKAVFLSMGLFAVQTNSATAKDPCFYYSDGHPCKVRDLGYDGEPTAKNGHCVSNKCVVDEILYGCTARPRPTVGSKIGCAYTCWKNHKLHYDYREVGQPCVHIVNSYSTVTTTCKQAGKRVLCRENITNADLLGC
uniref:Putative secreted protein n=1 Tax=Amblyomma triste TaxID=251400 RepID=A0A023G141_AMBTT